jgi:hypothetical protein
VTSESVIRIKELLELIRYTAENNAGGLYDQEFMDEAEALGPAMKNMLCEVYEAGWQACDAHCNTDTKRH